jgi:hypothetical protein
MIVVQGTRNPFFSTSLCGTTTYTQHVYIKNRINTFVGIRMRSALFYCVSVAAQKISPFG